MNYLRKKCTQGGTTLLLSNDQEKLKQYVLTELKQMESLSIPCCIISYNEICDNKGDNIERTSDLNPFINVNIKDCIKDNHKGYLWMLVSCLLTIEYSRQMTDDENRKIKEVCDKLDFTKDELPMSELFGYNTDLRSMTGGLGDYSYEFSRYEQAPGDVQKREIEARAAAKDGE